MPISKEGGKEGKKAAMRNSLKEVAIRKDLKPEKPVPQSTLLRAVTDRPSLSRLVLNLESEVEKGSPC